MIAQGAFRQNGGDFEAHDLHAACANNATWLAPAVESALAFFDPCSHAPRRAHRDEAATRIGFVHMPPV